MTYRLRYIPGTPDGDKFPTITYPLAHHPGYPTRERAERVLAAMPNPSRMEVFEGPVNGTIGATSKTAPGGASTPLPQGLADYEGVD